MRELHTSRQAACMIYPAGPVFRFLRLAALSLSMIYLAGCATTQPQYRVADVPTPPVIVRPELESINISSSMDPGSIIQAFRADIKRLQSTIMEYEKALDAYRKKDTK